MVPKLWAEYSDRDDLNWQIIKFDEETIEGRKDQLLGTGIYTLFIRSNVANHPHSDYLIYFGETEKQDFYTRWLQELKLPRTPPTQKRLGVFLLRWSDHVWACFAETNESIRESKV